jgi:hypothetical protein
MGHSWDKMEHKKMLDILANPWDFKGIYRSNYESW